MTFINYSYDDYNDEYGFGRFFIQLFQQRIMKGIVWYVKNGKFDFSLLYKNANNAGLQKWKNTAHTLTTGNGAFWTFVPLVGLPIDVVALLDGMMRTTYGIGAIYAKENGYGSEVLEREDFIDVLATWADATEFVGDKRAMEAMMNNFVSNRVMSKVGSKPAIKLATKTAAKIALKLSTKLATKLVSLIPGLAAVANGGINLWYMTEIGNAAEFYYSKKFRI